MPESEYICPRLTLIWRANQVATVPESQETMASSRSRLPSSQATTCGFIGLSSRVPSSSMSCHQSRMLSWAFSRNRRSSLRTSNGSSFCSVALVSPTSPTSMG